jgi:hypothetical protein
MESSGISFLHLGQTIGLLLYKNPHPCYNNGATSLNVVLAELRPGSGNGAGFFY